ncbi:MAG: amidohydrolase family protein, partial [Winkia neuii]|uniref:amidohydrolase family protein n=1 Tax=Winkia neuii TaxID=33007 RepID=UPI00241D473E
MAVSSLDGKVIDTHAHVYPAKYLDFLEQIGVDPDSTAIARDMNASDEADEAARMVNDIYAGLIRKYPGRFLAYGAIPFLHPQKAVQQIGYCMDELGFVGIAINSLLPDPQMAITDEQFAPIFAELDRRHAPLYIHPTGMSAHCAPMANQGLAWVNGAPVEDAIAALHLLKA